MPNTAPAARRRRGRELGARRRARRRPRARWCRRAASPMARAGEQLAPMGELHALGVRIFTDDGACVADAGVMRRALEYARRSRARSSRSTPRTRPRRRRRTCTRARGRAGSASPAGRRRRKTVIVARDIELCAVTGTPVHFLHVLRRRHRRARARGEGARPARSRPRRRRTTSRSPTTRARASTPCSRCTRRCAPTPTSPAIRDGLADGTIDAIATDHAPHTPESKERPFEEAPAGMLGLETALALTLTELVEPGHPLAAGRARAPVLAPGRDRRPAPTRAADRARRASPTSACSTPRSRWEVDPLRLASRARNTPFAGRKLTGQGAPHHPAAANRSSSTARPAMTGCHVDSLQRGFRLAQVEVQ